MNISFSTFKTLPPLWRYRAAVLSRTLVAVPGGYLLAAACAALGARIMWAAGMARVDAVLAATMLAFIVHAICALWAFGCATARRAWLGVVGPALLLTLLAWMLAPTAADAPQSAPPARSAR